MFKGEKMEITINNIDGGKNFDFGRTSSDYALKHEAPD